MGERNTGLSVQSRSGGSLSSANTPSEARYGTYFLGDYRVVDEIGVGGMASVHLARLDGPGGFQKWVAIKRIHPHLVEDDQFIHMFLDEARIAAGISHANVATVFSLGEGDGTYWIAMEYLHGEPLREVMRCVEEGAPRMATELAVKIIADAAEGLHAAHDLRGKDGQLLGLVHRDVTPHNLFITYDGTTKVVDFGIAKVAGRLSSTRAGTLKGKLAYMSPEQVRGGEIDRRTDIFALGVVLWELTTGHRLFRMENDLETLEKVQACIVPPPSTIVDRYPPELESLVMKALSKDRDQRFSTAREFARALQGYLVRRAAVVGPEEVGEYVRLIFADRIKKRDEHLQWAADVTQTISVGEFAGLSGPRGRGQQVERDENESSEVHATQRAAVVPRPAAGERALDAAHAKTNGFGVPTYTDPAPLPRFADSASSPQYGDFVDDAFDDEENIATIVSTPHALYTEVERPGPAPPGAEPSVMVAPGLARSLTAPAQPRPTRGISVGPGYGPEYGPPPGYPHPGLGPYGPVDYGATPFDATRPGPMPGRQPYPPTNSSQKLLIALVTLLALGLFSALGLAAFAIFRSGEHGAPHPDPSAATAPPTGTPVAPVVTTPPAIAPVTTAPPPPGPVASATAAAPSQTTAPTTAPKPHAPKPTGASTAGDPPSRDLGENGFLSVGCTPACTSVSANGRSLGPSPVISAPLPPGQYNIVMKRPGFANKSTSAVVVSGRTATVRASGE